MHATACDTGPPPRSILICSRLPQRRAPTFQRRLRSLQPHQALPQSISNFTADTGRIGQPAAERAAPGGWRRAGGAPGLRPRPGAGPWRGRRPATRAAAAGRGAGAGAGAGAGGGVGMAGRRARQRSGGDSSPPAPELALMRAGLASCVWPPACCDARVLHPYPIAAALYLIRSLFTEASCACYRGLILILRTMLARRHTLSLSL